MQNHVMCQNERREIRCARPRTMRLLGLILCLYVLFTKGLVAPAVVVTGPLNGNVTLPCTYSGQTTTTMCWGRGRCPSSLCNDAIIWTDGHKVTWRKSDRYQLLGNIGQRDVSLTITGVTKEDKGTYCCRVEIPGWNNDLKIERVIQITVASTIPPAPTTESLSTMYDHDPFSISPKMTSDDPAPINPQPENQDSGIEKTEDNKLPHIIASVVILSIALISAAALIFRYRHCKRKTKDSTRCSPIMSLEGLERTEQTEQNIYTIS